jgi:hypothetical protein
MPPPILPDCRWRTDLIEQRGIAMPESMETTCGMRSFFSRG